MSNRCPTGKARLKSELEVKIALADWTRKSKRRGKSRDKTPVRGYECPLCKGWHLTSQPQSGESTN